MCVHPPLQVLLGLTLSHFLFLDFSLAQPGYMHTLASELANEASPVFVRNAAGLALKNALTARVRRARPNLIPFLSYLVLFPLLIVFSSTGSPNRTTRARQSTPPAGSP
jgi:Importin-beta N-terminal domain